MKKITYLLTIVILLMSTTKVFANTNNHIVDFEKKGSINITLNDSTNNSVVTGANIKIYKLADAYSDNNNNLAFLYHNDLEECINNIEKEILNEETLKCIYNSNVITENKDTNNLGYTNFDNLQLGLYLIEQTNKVEGYSKIDPFLIYIPQVENNNWIYDIKATPKTDIIRLMDVIVEKVWDVEEGISIPNDVIIELLKDEEVIDEVTLSEENKWTHTWVQIEESDEYSVREKVVPHGYAFTYRQEGNKFIVTNIRALGSTGQERIIWLILGVLGLTLVIFGVIYDKKNKYE